jgi:hypothetical protein
MAFLSLVFPLLALLFLVGMERIERMLGAERTASLEVHVPGAPPG